MNLEQQLLQEFLDSDGIQSYDSTLCWGCGEVKESVSGINSCAADCLLERTRQVLANGKLRAMNLNVFYQQQFIAQVIRQLSIPVTEEFMIDLRATAQRLFSDRLERIEQKVK